MVEWDARLQQYVHHDEHGMLLVWSEYDNTWVPHTGAVVEEVAVSSAPTRSVEEDNNNHHPPANNPSVPSVTQGTAAAGKNDDKGTAAVSNAQAEPLADTAGEGKSNGNGDIAAADDDDELAAAERAFFEELGMGSGDNHDNAGGGGPDGADDEAANEAAAAAAYAAAFGNGNGNGGGGTDGAAVAPGASTTGTVAGTERPKTPPNRTVYFSNLHPSAGLEDAVAFFSRAGVLDMDIAKDPPVPMVKLYRTAEGTNKGDGLVTYLRDKSVRLAVDLLDGTEFMGQPVHVEEAVFASKRKRKRWTRRGPSAAGAIRSARDAKRIALEGKDPRAQLLWDEDTYLDETKGGRVVVLEGAYDPSELGIHVDGNEEKPTADGSGGNDGGDDDGGDDGDDDASAAGEATVKLEIAEAASMVGTLERCTLFPTNPTRPAALRFDSREACRAAIARFDGGTCRGRPVKCRFLGIGESLEPEDLRSAEDKQKEEEERHAAFAKWIEEGGEEPPKLT